jgi:hypothetical protein
MTNLPARPDIGQLRRQAKDLLRAARSGDPAAEARIAAVAGSMTLAAAQLAVAREYGFASWPRLKAEMDARSSDLAEQVDAFLEASMRDWTGRAARMLAATPQIAGYDFRTAVVLGDAGRVRQMLEHDQGRATRPDPQWGWTPLHAVCGSRWHRLDPARADGLLAVAGLLLDAGGDPAARTAGRQDGWTPLRCAVAGAANPAIARLLLERGATPDDPLRQRAGRPATARPRRGHRGTRYHLGQHPAGLGDRRQRPPPRRQPSPRLDRQHQDPHRGGRLHRRHHLVARRP